LRVVIATFVAEDCASGHDSQLWELGEAVDEAFGDPVREVVHAGIGTGVSEGQDGQRSDRLVWPCARLFFSYGACSGVLFPVQVSAFTQHLCDFGDEAVAELRHRLYVLMLSRAFAQSFPQDRDVAGQADLLNQGIRPYLLDQFVFLQHVPAVPDEHQKRLKGFRSQLNRLVVTQQEVFCRV
jgi:hypothetical protein